MDSSRRSLSLFLSIKVIVREGFNEWNNLFSSSPNMSFYTFASFSEFNPCCNIVAQSCSSVFTLIEKFMIWHWGYCSANVPCCLNKITLNWRTAWLFIAGDSTVWGMLWEHRFSLETATSVGSVTENNDCFKEATALFTVMSQKWLHW